jgi:hypothetical protein
MSTFRRVEGGKDLYYMLQSPVCHLLNLGYSNVQGHTNPLRGCTKKIQT